LEILFRKANLSDGPLKDTTTERAVTKSGNESNSWLRLFRHIRNCLAHGTFAILPRNEQGKVPVVMEDKDRTSYTARMVFSVISGKLQHIGKNLESSSRRAKTMAKRSSMVESPAGARFLYSGTENAINRSCVFLRFCGSSKSKLREKERGLK